MKESSGSRFQGFVVNHFRVHFTSVTGGGVCDQLCHLLSLCHIIVTGRGKTPQYEEENKCNQIR
jgi:hypothetical protein